MNRRRGLGEVTRVISTFSRSGRMGWLWRRRPSLNTILQPQAMVRPLFPCFLCLCFPVSCVFVSLFHCFTPLSRTAPAAATMPSFKFKNFWRRRCVSHRVVEGAGLSSKLRSSLAMSQPSPINQPFRGVIVGRRPCGCHARPPLCCRRCSRLGGNRAALSPANLQHLLSLRGFGR
jgi:hypothetical protein